MIFESDQCAETRERFHLPVARPVPNARLKCCRKAADLSAHVSAVRRRPRGVGSMFRLVRSESVQARGDAEPVFDTEPRVPPIPAKRSPPKKLSSRTVRHSGTAKTSFRSEPHSAQNRQGQFLRTARRSFRRRPRRSSRPRGTSADRAWSGYRRCRSPRIPRRRTPSPP